jgi:serine/threonine-protein kinase
MKRVEGRPWSELLTSPRLLVDHLETLVRVCDAVAFAHARGVLHRDIKPDNVMVGSFGEVYLVDWGLAVSLVPDAVLPLAADAGLAGTPAYMAPEMAAGDGRSLSERTDVYLLGATLYEILTGRLPHRGTNSEAVLAAALASPPPEFERPVPEELAAICTKAMAKRPDDRHQGAQAFKQAITEYLRHREAYLLFEQAQRGLKQLEGALGAGLLASQSGLQVHTVFAECRAASSR